MVFVNNDMSIVRGNNVVNHFLLPFFLRESDNSISRKKSLQHSKITDPNFQNSDLLLVEGILASIVEDNSKEPTNFLVKMEVSLVASGKP